jgi:Domain of Unknown Function with PDB structure (DUF3858)/Transglutaminase-like superfamily
MAKRTGLILHLLILLSATGVFAQEKQEFKFGKLSPADFKLSADQFDSGANAVVIADVGTIKFEGNNNSYFDLVFTLFMRVKINNKNGFDMGDRVISLYHTGEGQNDRIMNLKASTFNLENGVIHETKLDEKSIFTVKYNNRIDQKKFSMPALKEGAIFDLEYTVRSPFPDRMEPWSFQGGYPRLWSELVVTIPPPLHYMKRAQGDQDFYIDTTRDVYPLYSVRQSNGTAADNSYNVSGASIYRRWVKKNVPSLHEEPFTTTIDNYYSRITFQLSYVQWTKEDQRHEWQSTWNLLSKDLLEAENFGIALNRENGWMSDELQGIMQHSVSDEEKVNKIYSYVRDNFKTVSEEGYGSQGLATHNSLKDVFKKKQGNVAELNLLLTAMLRKAGIKADPMILSTRDNGLADPSYPLSAEYNYVICVAYLNDKLIKLDASEHYIGFGQLPIRCYNGWGHVVNPERPFPILFSVDSIHENSITTVIIINDENGKMSGTFKKDIGKIESQQIREEVGSTTVKEYSKKIISANESNLSIDNIELDSLLHFDYPLTVKYDFIVKKSAGDEILYFNPLLGEGYKNNPFKSMNRHYPVEIPYLLDETYILNMEIPAGYQVDEVPKSARVAYNNNEGMFEYLIQKGEGNIQMRVRLKLNKTLFPTDEYGTLRDFFAFVVKKENEQIVFKKIK